MSANRLQNGGLNRLYVLSTCFTLYHLNIIYNLVCTVSYTVQCSVQCTLYNTVLSHKIFCVSFLCNYMSLRMLSLCPSLHKKDNYFLCKQQLIYCSCTCTTAHPPPPLRPTISKILYFPKLLNWIGSFIQEPPAAYQWRSWVPGLSCRSQKRCLLVMVMIGYKRCGCLCR